MASSFPVRRQVTQAGRGAEPGADPIVARAVGVRLRFHARSLRGERSVAEAARLVGLNRDELARMERGETTQIRFETIAKLVAGYRCKLSDVIEVEPDPDAGSSVPRPLYAGVLAALGAGVLKPESPRRRTVRRTSAGEILAEEDETGFALSSSAISAHRRSPIGTLYRLN
ncbi:MAG: helix-turn-helix domain-containing protein [Acidimicrobiales bacterium]